MALNTTALAFIISLYRAWVGAGAFDRIRHEFDLMSRTGLTGKERRDQVVHVVREEFTDLAEAAILAAVQLLWLQVPTEIQAKVQAIAKEAR